MKLGNVQLACMIVTALGAATAAAAPATKLSASAPAISLSPCTDGIESVVAGKVNHRTLFGDDVAVYQLDRGAPVSVSRDIAIVYIEASDTETRRCVVVGGAHGGYYRVNMAKSKVAAKKQSATVTIPVTHYSPDGQHTAGVVEIYIASAPKQNPARRGYTVTARGE